MIRKFLMLLGLSATLGVGAALVAPSDAAAGWRGGHRGFHAAHRGHFGGPRFARGHFYRHHYGRPWAHRAHFIRRPYRPHFVHAGFYGPRFVAPVRAYGADCLIKKRVRWNRWGERVQVVKRICY